LQYNELRSNAQHLNVLFVEDDKFFGSEFKSLLDDIFYPNIVSIAYDGEEGFKKYLDYYKVNNSYYDIVLTDLRMPNLDGIGLTKNIYEVNPKQTIIVLSARNEFDYLVNLLNMGIEHFFPKPIVYDKFVDELTLICKKVNRSKEKELIGKKEERVTLAKNIFWDISSKELFRGNQAIHLTKKELDLLSILMKNNGGMVSIDELFTLLWMPDELDKATMNNLKNIIFRLRKKVPELEIESFYGVGYKLIFYNN
jgi:DNA-binding response OmpR family regulator